MTQKTCSQRETVNERIQSEARTQEKLYLVESFHWLVQLGTSIES